MIFSTTGFKITFPTLVPIVAILIASPRFSLNHAVSNTEMGSSVLPVKKMPLIRESGRMH